MRIGQPPPDFRDLEVGGVVLRARGSALGWAREAVQRGESLFEVAARHPDREVLQGRGPTFVLPAPGEGAKRWVVRHYRRGGWMARILEDRYLDWGPPRPFLEIDASERARERGVRTPRVVAGAVYPRGLFYRADLVTEYVPDSRDLAEVLFQVGPRSLSTSVDRREALMAAGELLRKMGRAGVNHPDMNAKNVLLRWSGAAPDPHLVDLDRVRIVEEGARGLVGTMHARLVRSLRKLEKASGKHVSPRELEILAESVEGGR